MEPEPNPDPDLGHEYLFKIYWFFKQRKNFRIIFLTFFTIFMQQLDEPFRDKDILNNLSFFNSSDLGIESRRFFAVFGWYFALGSKSRDPHIFADPDPDPKHRNWQTKGAPTFLWKVLKWGSRNLSSDKSSPRFDISLSINNLEYSEIKSCSRETEPPP